ncbi:MAG: sulfite oxidase heme-binding subunit YedZ [Gammaproteobacteria bacterium]
MAFPTTRQVKTIIKPAWFLACLLPFLLILFDAFTDDLGADPIEAIQDRSGIWGLRFLLLTLALTPIRKLTGQIWVIQFRRMTGLYSLFFITLHFLNYLTLDQGLAWSFIVEDVLERPFITLGFIALLGLVPLGITSTTGWRQRLGKRWQKLHNLVYPIAILGCWHFWWQVKQDITEPLIYAAILAVLLGYRLLQNKKRPAPV